MTFVNHGIAGSLIHGLIGFLVWNNPVFIGIIASTGFIFGVMPDILAWYHRVLLGEGDWSAYNDIHNGKTNDTWKYVPAWGYHTWVDSFIHPYPEHKIAYHVVESAHWVAYVVFVFVFFV